MPGRLLKHIMPGLENTRDDAGRFYQIGLNILLIGDFEGRIVSVNSGFSDKLGWQAEEMVGQGWADFLHSDEMSDASALFEKLKQEDSRWEIDQRYLHKDGSYRWLRWSCASFIAEQLIYCSAVEVTSRKLQEEAIRIGEERHRLMARATNDVMRDWDIERDVMEWSSALHRVFGYAARDFRNNSEGWMKLVHPHDRERVSQHLQKCLRSGSLFFEQQYRMQKRDGSFLDVLDRAYVICDSRGNPVRMVGSLMDMSQQRKVQEALRESGRQFREMADSINQMIWVTRPDGYHEYFNKRWYEFTGMNPGDTDGDGWKAVFHPADVPLAKERWHRSLESGESYEIEYRLRRADGVYRWALGRAECLRDEKGGITKWYGTCTDIQDLVDARNKAELANVAKTEFLANMSHEIRTPMNAVVGLANILALSAPLSERQKEFISTLKLSANALLELINDLLDISKIESGNVSIEQIGFSLEKLVLEIESLMELRADEKGLSFTLAHEGIAGRRFVGDPTRIRQIMLNLCSNAIKFTEKGSVDVSLIYNTPEVGPARLRLVVQDSGIGIEPAKREAIFQKFTQADNTITRRYGGTGLGLAITKSLVEAMGGTIELQSEVEHGSCFIISIPLRVEISQAAQPLRVVPAGQLKQTRRFRLLLVEDHAPNVLVARTFLEEFGYECDVAGNGMAALEMLEQNRYPLVLMDVQMPEMNGMEATRRFRELEVAQAAPRTPIIGMTAHALSGDREKCLAAGMDDYITKPFKPAELQQKIRDLLAAA